MENYIDFSVREDKLHSIIVICKNFSEVILAESNRTVFKPDTLGVYIAGITAVNSDVYCIRNRGGIDGNITALISVPC